MIRLARPLPRLRQETIVALVDVVFFLLVFALLVGRFDATAPFAVSPPLAVTGTDMPGGGVTVAISSEGGFALDGRAVDAEELGQMIGARLARDAGTRIRINADGALALGRVLPLVEDLTRRGARDVILVVTPGG